MTVKALFLFFIPASISLMTISCSSFFQKLLQFTQPLIYASIYLSFSTLEPIPLPLENSELPHCPLRGIMSPHLKFLLGKLSPLVNARCFQCCTFVKAIKRNHSCEYIFLLIIRSCIYNVNFCQRDHQ